MSVDAIRQMSLEDALDDLSSRFIVSLPGELRSSPEHLCFQIEQAYWFYDDFYRAFNSRLPKLSWKSFAQKICDRCPVIQFDRKAIPEILEKFSKYKLSIPVCGAVILDESLSQVLLVKDWGTRSWSFPRGKINQNEPEYVCAIREVYEETGFNIEPFLHQQDFVEIQLEKRFRMYMVAGVPVNSHFETHTRKEISDIAWHHLSDLGTELQKGGAKFFLLRPFLPQILAWIEQRRYGKAPAHQQGHLKQPLRHSSSAPAMAVPPTTAKTAKKQPKAPTVPSNLPVVGVSLPLRPVTVLPRGTTTTAAATAAAASPFPSSPSTTVTVTNKKTKKIIIQDAKNASSSSSSAPIAFAFDRAAIMAALRSAIASAPPTAAAAATTEGTNTITATQ